MKIIPKNSKRSEIVSCSYIFGLQLHYNVGGLPSKECELRQVKWKQESKYQPESNYGFPAVMNLMESMYINVNSLIIIYFIFTISAIY